MVDPSDAGTWVIALTAGMVGGGWYSLRWLRVARLVEDMPTSRIRSAAQGYVEIAGRCRPLDGTSQQAPLTGRPCVWWRYTVQRRSGGDGKRRENWVTVASGRSAVPFLLDDGTGTCIVQPAGAEVMTGESTTWYGDTPWPAGIPSATAIRIGEREYRYHEERIYEHELLCVIGHFRTHAAATDRDLDAEQAELLARWKSDQAALVQRFDADRDGRISLAEWERAREEARREVAGRTPESPAAPSLNVLGRPDGDQLYLIAAFPERDVARRYRRRAIAAFAVFLGATVALGWLLQHAFG